MRCRTCKFWLEDSGQIAYDEKGQCRRNPPDHSKGWPRTKPDDWCGEHIETEQLVYKKRGAR